jgi:uncharacterized membrane protein YccC
MMTENIIVAVVGLIATALGASVMWYVAVRKTPRELRVMGSQETENLAHALNDATQALINQGAATTAERKDMKSRIVELERVQGERTQTILDLTNQIEALNREYAREFSALKRQWREWYLTLKVWLDENKLTGYPEPPSGLLDTGKHTKVEK